MVLYISTDMNSKCRNLTIITIILSLSLGVFNVGRTQTSTQLQNEQNVLQEQLKQIEQEIAKYEIELNGIRKDKNTLANKIKQLKTKQASLQAKIKATKLHIAALEKDLNTTLVTIDKNNQELEVLKRRMSSVLQELQAQGEFSLLDILLLTNSLSEFYTEVENFNRINEDLSAFASDIEVANKKLEATKEKLATQKEQQQNLISIINLQRQELTATIDGQNSVLAETKGREANYQKIVQNKKDEAAAIRNRIYDLLEVGKKVTFGEALQIATWASSKTGVRPAFLLAVLTQESNLGKNVGTCNRLGDPPSKSWRVVMKPTRDQQPFLIITKELGRDPDITPVSCPMRDSRGNQIGWGGAMGPAQFIPSTWMGYKDKVKAITGEAANPWDIRDAFLAAGLKLKAGGAGTQSGEWAAAMRYFSGSTNTRFRFYGDNVVAIANRYQIDIDNLN